MSGLTSNRADWTTALDEFHRGRRSSDDLRALLEHGALDDEGRQSLEHAIAVQESLERSSRLDRLRSRLREVEQRTIVVRIPEPIASRLNEWKETVLQAGDVIPEPVREACQLEIQDFLGDRSVTLRRYLNHDPGSDRINLVVTVVPDDVVVVVKCGSEEMVQRAKGLFTLEVSSDIEELRELPRRPLELWVEGEAKPYPVVMP